MLCSLVESDNSKNRIEAMKNTADYKTESGEVQ